MGEYPFQELDFELFEPEEMECRGRRFLQHHQKRRSVRDFSERSVPRVLIEHAIRIAGAAPSGANCQPWRFVAVAESGLKRQIREAAEAEEKKSYEERMPDEWLEELAPLGTSWRKPFLEKVPWLVVVFAESYRVDPEGNRRKNYYVQESVGIACGFFIAALHEMGLATLTHTPSPMGFLREILGRPVQERPYILFPVGFPAEGAQVPVLEKKSLDSIATFVD